MKNLFNSNTRGCIFLVIFLLCFSAAYAQESFSGRVMSSSNNLGIPFASIGLLKTNRGTSANNQGYFQFSLNVQNGDSLIFSSVGFSTKKVAVGDFVSGVTIVLVESEDKLPSIIVTSSKLKDVKLNDYGSAGFNTFINSGVTKVLAQQFQSPNKNMYLKKIKLSKSVGQCIFLIKVYRLDSVSLKPGQDLLDTIVQVNSKNKNIVIDMEKYNIFLNSKDFFVGVQWLFIDENSRQVKSSLGGRKILHKEYLPSLFVDYEKSASAQPLKTWQLDFREKWNIISSTMKLKMTATVGY